MLRLVVFGTGPFAAPLLEALYASRHEVAALVTQPQRSVRGKAAAPSPMRALAERRATPIFDPEDVNTDEARARIAAWRPDALVVADYGQILAPETLALARLGGVNLHGSLLPKYRGAAPINWAIYHGDSTTGVTVIGMTPRVDAGPCLAKAELAIDPAETAVDLEQRLARLGAPLVCETLDALEAGRTNLLPQDPSAATKARRLRKSDGAIDWSRPALDIQRQIRALEPWPRTYTFWHRAGSPSMRLILGRTEALAGSTGAAAGEVVEAARDQLVIACGSGALRLLVVQPSGKQPMAVDAFLRGHPVAAGQRFGPDEA